MKKLFFILSFCILFFQSFAQTSIGGTRVMFPCDACSGSNNPLAYLGGNIELVTFVDSPEGRYLKLTAGSTIDTNAVPAYFDIYSLFTRNEHPCSSFRASDISVDFSYDGQYETRFNSSIDGAGYRLWLASASGLPGPGESTFQTNPSDPLSQFILDGKVYDDDNGTSFSIYSNTPVWKDWTGNSKINMFGFTGLEPNAEYKLYEVNIGQYIPVRLASYDCTLPNAVKNELQVEKIKIYPLPAAESINIEMAYTSESYMVHLISDSGKLVYSACHIDNATVPLLGLSKGLYLMKINIGDQYFTKKLVIE